MIDLPILSIGHFKDGRTGMEFKGITIYSTQAFVIVKDLDHEKYYLIVQENGGAMDITEEWTSYAKEHEDFDKVVDLTIWFIKESVQAGTPVNPLIPPMFVNQIEPDIAEILSIVRAKLEKMVREEKKSADTPRGN